MLRRNLLILLFAATAVIVLVSLGCDDLVTQTIETTTAGNPTAEFTATPDSGCVPLHVVFEDASSGPVRTWIWNYGDSTFDTVHFADSGDGDVSHTFTEVGSYTVTLSVFDTINGSDAETKKRAVIVGTNIDRFDLSDTLVCPGQEITFRAINPFGVTGWNWNFGDGTVLTDDSTVQTHTYAAAGIYEVRLTVTGTCGTSLLVDSVHVLECAQPLFTFDPAYGCVPFTSTFTDASVPPAGGSIIHWHWNFGNGQVRDFNGAPGPIEIDFTTSDTFPVTLTVTSDSGGVTTFTDTIFAFPSGNASFLAQPLTGCEIPSRQFQVAFSRTPAGDTAWLWDFGDGDTAHARNVSHAYTAPGVYEVNLQIFGACGVEVDTVTDTIIYYDQLQPTSLSFTYSETDSLTVVFVDESPDAAVVTRFWSFDGVPGGAEDSTVIKDTIEYKFTTSGPKTVRLSRFNGCSTDTLWTDTTFAVPEPPPGF